MGCGRKLKGKIFRDQGGAACTVMLGSNRVPHDCG